MNIKNSMTAMRSTFGKLVDGAMNNTVGKELKREFNQYNRVADAVELRQQIVKSPAGPARDALEAKLEGIRSELSNESKPIWGATPQFTNPQLIKRNTDSFEK
jgi:hypothetical protein